MHEYKLEGLFARERRIKRQQQREKHSRIIKKFYPLLIAVALLIAFIVASTGDAHSLANGVHI